ncbi:MAG: hypothetical protein ACXQT3_06170 [Methermicoccaceae archaeon]
MKMNTEEEGTPLLDLIAIAALVCLSLIFVAVCQTAGSNREALHDLSRRVAELEQMLEKGK